MFELRILSGLHRGATLPLSEEALSLGASDEADVVLLDEGIKLRHASLSKTENGWLLSQEDGGVFSAASQVAHTLLDLDAGDFARIGPVWIVIVAQDSAWENPPAMPPDEDRMLVDQLADTLADPQTETIAGALPGEPSVATEAAALAASDGRSGRQRQFKRVLLLALGSSVVLSAAAAYAMSAKTSQSPGAGLQAALPAAAALSPEQLRKAFKKRLADADLLRHMELQLEEQAWNIQADLDEEQGRRFERILKTFLLEHKIVFPVHAKLLSAEELLPFKIRQVISGANASVVTHDGQRLFVGEELHGVRLLAIQDNRLTFAGKRKIEMSW